MLLFSLSNVKCVFYFQEKKEEIRGSQWETKFKKTTKMLQNIFDKQKKEIGKRLNDNNEKVKRKAHSCIIYHSRKKANPRRHSSQPDGPNILSAYDYVEQKFVLGDILMKKKNFFDDFNEDKGQILRAQNLVTNNLAKFIFKVFR